MSNLDHLKPSATCFLRFIFQCQKLPLAHSPCRFVAMPHMSGWGVGLRHLQTVPYSSLFIDFGLVVPSLFQPLLALLDKIAGTIPGTPQYCYSVSNSEANIALFDSMFTVLHGNLQRKHVFYCMLGTSFHASRD